MSKTSIIILAYNHWDITTRCLASLLSAPVEREYEVILVDNGSEAPMPDYYPSMLPGIRIVHSEFNRGYGGGYNFAAEFANGDELVLLSNDIIVTPGWLDELHRVKVANPGTLIVGPKYLTLDGTLLEAGSVVFNDGTPWALGRGNDSRSPFFNFVRESHYVSTACVLVDRNFFITTGGFDPRYGAGYFEDTDLCTRAHQIGGHVMYTPLACILHQESSSFGNQKAALMDKNRQVFAEKWRPYLASNYPDPSLLPLRAAIAWSRVSVLVVDKVLPWHDRASGAKRTMEILRLLKKSGCHVTFVAIEGRNQEAYARELQRMGIEVFVNDGLGIGMPEVGAVPWEELFQNRRYDYVWLTFWDVAAYYLGRLRKLSKDAKFVVDSVDLEFVRMASETVGTGIESFDRERSLREIAVYQASDTVITVTELERDILRKTGVSKPIEVIPNIHDVAVPDLSEDRTSRSRQILFVGNFNHAPNRDAILTFAHDIFPELYRQLGVRLLIAGNNPTEEIAQLASIPGVEVLGWVPDLNPIYRNILAAVAPLRYGAGIKGKITEALSMAVPVIATPEALTGMEAVIENEAVLIAPISDPNGWVTAVNKLLDPPFWKSISRKAWATCLTLYSSERANEVLRRIIL